MLERTLLCLFLLSLFLLLCSAINSKWLNVGSAFFDIVYAAAHSQCTARQAGNITLIGSVNNSVIYGGVSICDGTEWRTVCNTGWDMNDTIVVCRNLGYSTEGLLECYKMINIALSSPHQELSTALTPTL